MAILILSLGTAINLHGYPSPPLTAPAMWRLMYLMATNEETACTEPGPAAEIRPALGPSQSQRLSRFPVCHLEYYS